MCIMHVQRYLTMCKVPPYVHKVPLYGTQLVQRRLFYGRHPKNQSALYFRIGLRNLYVNFMVLSAPFRHKMVCTYYMV